MPITASPSQVQRADIATVRTPAARRRWRRAPDSITAATAREVDTLIAMARRLGVAPAQTPCPHRAQAGLTMSFDHAEGGMDITVLRLDGNLDAATFESLIERGRDLYESGVRALLVDLSEVGCIRSSGLVALHSLALILQGRQPPNPEHGWNAFHAIDAAIQAGPQPNLKILGPQPAVLRALEHTGVTQFIEVHVNEQVALDSF